MDASVPLGVVFGFFVGVSLGLTGGGGAAAGLLSGLFGVGGGFIVLPALLFVTGMDIRRAVATSSSSSSSRSPA